MNRTDPKGSCQQVILIASQTADNFGLFQNLSGMPNDLLADCRDMDASVGPLEKRSAEFFLQLVNLPRKRGLAYKTALGGLSKVQGFTHGNKVFKVPEVHLDNRSNRLK